MKKIVGVSEQLVQHSPSEVAAELYEAVNTLDKGVLSELVEIKKQFVKFGGASYKELFFTIMFAAEGLVPTWLGGTELPNSAGSASKSDTVNMDLDIEKQIALALERTKT